MALGLSYAQVHLCTWVPLQHLRLRLWSPPPHDGPGAATGAPELAGVGGAPGTPWRKERAGGEAVQWEEAETETGEWAAQEGRRRRPR